MTNRDAYSWLMQPGIQATMDKYDRQSKDAINVAVKSLRKQIPIPYKIKHDPSRAFIDGNTKKVVEVFTYHCPCCDECFGDSDWDGKPDGDWNSYCGNCGQKIDFIHDVDLPEYEPTKNVGVEKVGYIYG